MKTGNTENPQLTHFKIEIKKNYELWKREGNWKGTMCRILQDIRVVPLIEPGKETETEEPIQCKYGPGNLTCEFTVVKREVNYFNFSLQEGESREFLALKIQILKRIKHKEKHLQKLLRQQKQSLQLSKSKRNKVPTWVFSGKPDKNMPKSPRKKSPNRTEGVRRKTADPGQRSPRNERRHQSSMSKKM